MNDQRASAARERLIRILAAKARTTQELARELGVTPNAVRAQLALLMREGVIEEGGRARGTRRPSAIFKLRPGAEVRLSRAYPLALSRLVGAAGERLRNAAFVDVLLTMGRRMAASVPPAQGDAAQRVKAAGSLLEEFGSRTEISKQAGKYILRLDACPLGEAVSVDGRTCLSMTAMLQELTGLTVIERCERGEHPRCSFEIHVPPSRARKKKSASGSGGA